MVTKRYVKKAYILEAICDKCGNKMGSTGMVFTYPEQYPYHCTNKNCDGYCTLQVRYEFEDEVNADV